MAIAILSFVGLAFVAFKIVGLLIRLALNLMRLAFNLGRLAWLAAEQHKNRGRLWAVRMVRSRRYGSPEGYL